MKKKIDCEHCDYVGRYEDHVKVELKLERAAIKWVERGELKDWNALTMAAELYANRKKRSKK